MGRNVGRLIFLVMTAIIVYSIAPKYTATTKIIVDVAAKDLLDRTTGGLFFQPISTYA